MIGRGKQNNILLFEVTEQDLLDTGNFPATYEAGNVLLFDSRQSICIGQELARADDLFSALEFLHEPLDSLQSAANELYTDEEAASPTGASPILAAEMEMLKTSLAQRDGLLNDLSHQLKLQKEENELLQLLLEQSQSQIAMVAVSRDEIIDDLKQASASSQIVEINLEHVMEEKYMLEQELAEKITELIETNMANDDLLLQMQTYQSFDNVEKIADWLSAAELPDQPESSQSEAETLPLDQALLAEQGMPPIGNGLDEAQDLLVAEQEISQVLTMSTGKRIHVYHEFPTLTKRRPSQVIKAFCLTVLKSTVAVFILVMLSTVGSVIATSWSNQISLGQALDILYQKAIEFLS
ncbi:MAG: hypothetical protein FWH40_02705 [Coriobacteriia bacterium]|nr:hypothetical protein [Coriobacteriia bacterium]